MNQYPYELTLSKSERDAIDWIGDRYSHGYDLYEQLCNASWMQDGKGEKYEEIDWCSSGDITFYIAEATAWVILDIGEECEYRWDCLAPELAQKLTEFCSKIV